MPATDERLACRWRPPWWPPKPRLRWTQPRPVVREVEKSGGKRSRIIKDIGALVCVAMLMALWHLHGRKIPISDALGLAILMGVFVRYGIPWLFILCPSLIQISKAGILRQYGDKHRLWRYKDISNCIISTLDVKGKNYPILILMPSNEVLGIAASISLDELEKVLREKGLTVDRKMTPYK